jgi:3-methyladenine DNA glycosylase AlkD
VILLDSGATPMPKDHATRSTAEPARSPTHTAERYIQRLRSHRAPSGTGGRQRSFKSRAADDDHGEGDVVIGVRMKQVFELSREFTEMPLGEIEKLLESRIHEVRAGGVKIMAYQAASTKASEGRRRELFELYLRRHDRINDWDLVDLGAWDVVGRYLMDRPREVLYRLARSTSVWERRTAILATLYFVRRGDLDDTFRIAEELVNDDHDLVRKAVGGSLREAGRHDRGRLLTFLDDHAATMPRTALRYAIEHLDKDRRADYLSRKEVKPQP